MLNQMLFFIYQILFTLALPFICLRLFIRGKKEPGYRQRWHERYGCAPKMPEALQKKRAAGGKTIWLHTVSVGELRAALPLINALLQDLPQHILYITCTTASGSQQIQQLLGDKVWHSYLPYDLMHFLKRHWKTVQPACLAIMETELWPALLRMAQQHQTPTILVNACLSERSAQRYAYIKPIVRQMLRTFDCIAAQSDLDKQRFIQLDARPSAIQLCSNLKYIVPIDENLLQQATALRAAWETDGHHFIWTAGSIHIRPDLNEVEAIIAAHTQLIAAHNTARLVLVPRHPRDLSVYTEILEKNKLRFLTLSQITQQAHAWANNIPVLLVDSIGQLLQLYAATDAAFVGGSLTTIGGHNLLEPVALHKPVISGPHLENCRSIYKQLTAVNGISIVQHAEQLYRRLLTWAQNPTLAQQQAQAAFPVLAHHQESLQFYCQWFGAQIADKN